MKDTHSAAVGRTVRRLRQERSMTGDQLAERADLPRSAVFGLEQGRRNVTVDDIAVLAAALGVQPADLLPDDWAKPSRDALSDAFRPLIRDVVLDAMNEAVDQRVRAVLRQALIGQSV